ncbi:MAG: hypothetical protein ACNA7W_17160, partial [Pseudomonadales bacterium]
PAAPAERRYRPTAALLRTLARAAFAAVVMGLTLAVLLPEPAEWLEVDVWQRAWWLLLAVPSGAALYLLLLVATGERPRGLMHRV